MVELVSLVEVECDEESKALWVKEWQAIVANGRGGKVVEACVLWWSLVSEYAALGVL